MDVYEEFSSQSLGTLNMVGSFKRSEMRITSDDRIVRRSPQVFLSHNNNDKRFVRSLARKLEASGLKVWLDEVQMEFGDSLIDRLSEAIDTVDVLVAVISHHSLRSSWVQHEIEIAMTQEIQQKRIKVIPLLIEKVKLPAFLEGKVYADFTNGYRRKRNISKLVRSIRLHTNSDDSA